MKALIFDSGTLINLSMNGLLYILEDLKKTFDGKFLITREVKYEVFDRPIGIQRFELGALQIENLVEKGIIELPRSVGITDEEIKAKTREIKDIANHFIQVDRTWVEIVSDGEMSCLALSDELTKRGVTNLIATDERTTRTLCEDPQNLERIMSNKLHKRVELVARDLNIFSKFRFIRSSEIVYVAYKKNLINLGESKKVLEALLYATKFKGSAISFEEIDELKRL